MPADFSWLISSIREASKKLNTTWPGFAYSKIGKCSSFLARSAVHSRRWPGFQGCGLQNFPAL
jgi:hypothetical protein